MVNEINDLFCKEGEIVLCIYFGGHRGTISVLTNGFGSELPSSFWMKFNDKNTKTFVGTCVDETLWIFFSNATDEEVAKVENGR